MTEKQPEPADAEPVATDRKDGPSAMLREDGSLMLREDSSPMISEGKEATRHG